MSNDCFKQLENVCFSTQLIRILFCTHINQQQSNEIHVENGVFMSIQSPWPNFSLQFFINKIITRFSLVYFAIKKNQITIQETDKVRNFPTKMQMKRTNNLFC